jgi:hypothetical protein
MIALEDVAFAGNPPTDIGLDVDFQGILMLGPSQLEVVHGTWCGVFVLEGVEEEVISLLLAYQRFLLMKQTNCRCYHCMLSKQKEQAIAIAGWQRKKE